MPTEKRLREVASLGNLLYTQQCGEPSCSQLWISLTVLFSPLFLRGEDKLTASCAKTSYQCPANKFRAPLRRITDSASRTVDLLNTR